MITYQKSLSPLHLILSHYLFKNYLKKKDIEIDPVLVNIRYGIKKYKVENKLILFPSIILEDKKNNRIKVEILCFEKIKQKKYYKTSIISLIQ